MSKPSTVDKARPSRGRRGSRPSGDDRELAILTTAERLLAEHALSEISIDDLAKGAGISRPTFYFYFPSKDAVLLTLLDRVVAEADSAAFGVDGLDAPGAAGGDPTCKWREAIEACFVTFHAHRSVAVAVAQLSATNSEVRTLWTRVMESWVRRAEEAITAERDLGAAPPGLPARELAVALNLMNERVMLATFAGREPAIEESRVVDTLLTVWMSAIYPGGRIAVG